MERQRPVPDEAPRIGPIEPILTRLEPRAKPHPKNNSGSKTPRKRGRRVTVLPHHVATAKALLANAKGGLGQAMIAGGYAPSTARNPGITITNTPALVAALKAELAHYETPPAERVQLIRRRLVKEILEAHASDAIRAAEVAGKDKELRLWQPDVQVGIFQSNAPGGITHLFETDQPELLTSSDAPQVVDDKQDKPESA